MIIDGYTSKTLRKSRNKCTERKKIADNPLDKYLYAITLKETKDTEGLNGWRGTLTERARRWKAGAWSGGTASPRCFRRRACRPFGRRCWPTTRGCCKGRRPRRRR